MFITKATDEEEYLINTSLNFDLWMRVVQKCAEFKENGLLSTAVQSLEQNFHTLPLFLQVKSSKIKSSNSFCSNLQKFYVAFLGN